MMAGFTEGDWYGTNKGDRDFMAVKLRASDGRKEAWRWQVGAGLAVILRVLQGLTSTWRGASSAQLGARCGRGMYLTGGGSLQ